MTTKKSAATDEELATLAKNGVGAEAMSFWDVVGLAEQLWLPKAHLTQPDVISELEGAMGALDEMSRVNAFRQVLTGAMEGRYSQMAIFPFAHFAWTKNEDGTHRNRIPEAKRFASIVDAIVAESAEDSLQRRRQAAYAEMTANLRDESGHLDENRLVQAVIETAERSDEPFWVDSAEFIFEGEVRESDLQLSDLVRAGAISIEGTAGGGTKVHVAGGQYMTSAVDRLEEAGFTEAAKVLRVKTQRKQHTPAVGAGLRSLVPADEESSSDDS